MKLDINGRWAFLVAISAAVILAGCKTLGTATLYKAEDIKEYKYSRFGYTQLANETKLNKIRSNTSRRYEAAMQSFFEEKPIEIEKCEIDEYRSFKYINIDEIIRLCVVQNLDGIIYTELKYKFENRSGPVVSSIGEKTFVEMKLFSRDGTLVIHTAHSTIEVNSDSMTKRAPETVEDATIGALKRIYKEIKR